MKTIDSIIIHCSATKAGQDLRAKDIDRMHKQRGFNQIGYNFVVDLDGTVENGCPLSIDGAHCNTKGLSDSSYNKHSIGIAILVVWMPMENRPTPGLTGRKFHFVTWLQSFVKSILLSKCSDIGIHRLT